MKTVEITLDEGLHRKLQKESKATSQSIERLIRNLLAQSLRQTVPPRAFSTKLNQSQLGTQITICSCSILPS